MAYRTFDNAAIYEKPDLGNHQLVQQAAQNGASYELQKRDQKFRKEEEEKDKSHQLLMKSMEGGYSSHPKVAEHQMAANDEAIAAAVNGNPQEVAQKATEAIQAKKIADMSDRAYKAVDDNIGQISKDDTYFMEGEALSDANKIRNSGAGHQGGSYNKQNHIANVDGLMRKYSELNSTLPSNPKYFNQSARDADYFTNANTAADKRSNKQTIEDKNGIKRTISYGTKHPFQVKKGEKEEIINGQKEIVEDWQPARTMEDYDKAGYIDSYLNDPQNRVRSKIGLEIQPYVKEEAKRLAEKANTENYGKIQNGQALPVRAEDSDIMATAKENLIRTEAYKKLNSRNTSESDYATSLDRPPIKAPPAPKDRFEMGGGKPLSMNIKTTSDKGIKDVTVHFPNSLTLGTRKANGGMENVSARDITMSGDATDLTTGDKLKITGNEKIVPTHVVPVFYTKEGKKVDISNEGGTINEAFLKKYDIDKVVFKGIGNVVTKENATGIMTPQDISDKNTILAIPAKRRTPFQVHKLSDVNTKKQSQSGKTIMFDATPNTMEEMTGHDSWQAILESKTASKEAKEVAKKNLGYEKMVADHNNSNPTPKGQTDFRNKYDY